MKWESEDLDNNQASMPTGALYATFTLTGAELALARSNAGLTLTEEIRWREEDPGPDDNVKTTTASYKANIAANANSVSLQYAPTDWTTTVNDWVGSTLEGPTAEFYGWLNDPDSPNNFKTKRIDTQSGGPAGGFNTTGYVTTTPGVGYVDGSAFANPPLPNLAPGAGSYRILAANSQNGTDFTVTAANTSGYTLLAASSNALAWDATIEDTVIPQTTTFTTAYADGSAVAGEWAGGETAWAIRSADGSKTFYLTGYGYSKMPAAALGLPDGQSTTVSGPSIEAGSDALWLLFETDGETVAFLLTGHPTNIAPVAVDDGTTVLQNGSMTTDVRANDIDADGDVLTITAVTQAANGTVTFTGTSVTYTPNAGYTGSDSFAYTVSDGYGGTSTATVTVNVILPVTISGSLWEDLNGDGIWVGAPLEDLHDGGIWVGEPLATQPVQVYLFDGAGNQLAVTTAVNGNYSFTGLPPGDYQVRVEIPPGKTVSPKDAGGDDAIDNDFDSFGHSSVFFLAPGDNLDLDIGWW